MGRPQFRRIVMILPNFLVIGAAKGGTTSLHFYLRQHPEVYLTPVKETNFYWQEGRETGRKIPRTVGEYAKFFEDAAGARAIGEISPQYLNSPTAAARIAADLPHSRLIACLRNPADRAYSDYLGRVRIARESRPIEEAIRPGERIFEDGLYYPRLKRYFDRFPREQIHVVIYDDFARDPGETLRGIFAFLDVAPGIPIDTSTAHNAAAAPRSVWLNRLLWGSIPAVQKLVPRRWHGSGVGEALLRATYHPADPFPPVLRRSLGDAYRADILATAELIGQDLSAWLV